MTKMHLVHDNLDDRREVYRLLGRLSPADRVAYLGECVRGLVARNGVRPRLSIETLRSASLALRDDTADHRLTTDLYFDWWSLVHQFDMDAERAVRRLEAWVRRRR